MAGEGEVVRFGEATIVIREDAESTGGALTILEELPPMLDTPMHVHSKEDEVFYVLDGRHVITLGEEEHELGPGESIFLPRGVPHAQRRVVPGEGHQLVICTPAGLEQFFRDLGAAHEAGTLAPDAYAAASEAAGITWL